MDSDIRPAKRPRPRNPEPPRHLDFPQADRPAPAKKLTSAPPEPQEPELTIDENEWDANDTATNNAKVPVSPKKPKSGWKDNWKGKMKLHWPPGKKEWITFLVILLLIGGGVAGYMLTHKSKPATIKPIPKITAQTKVVPSTLTGLPVDPTVNQRTVTAVMIENSIDARPQSGLGQAGVVFEAIAEAGITRFLALYQDTAPDNVGPIRSARPYYLQWELGFDAGYAHVGGSPDALTDIQSWGVHDLNQFYNGSFYHRVSSRAAPHNVYTSIAQLNQLEVNKGYTTSHYTGFVRKKKAFRKKSQPITAKSIDLAISGPTYNVHYDYNVKTNSYLRSEGGSPHIDANTNQQISPVVVIAMIVPESQGALDATGAYYSDYNVIGSGPVYVFQDGAVTTGQWNKAGNTNQITFTDATGNPLPLDPGQTWLTALSNSNQVTYTP